MKKLLIALTLLSCLSCEQTTSHPYKVEVTRDDMGKGKITRVTITKDVTICRNEGQIDDAISDAELLIMQLNKIKEQMGEQK